jgi:predicted amidohydrolase
MSSLTFTLLQSKLYWEDREANLAAFSDKINNIKDKTQVIILPEMFSTGFSMKPEMLAESMDGPTVGWMKKTAREKGAILTGSVIIEEAGLYFNRLIWMLPNGQSAHYDKRHLFAYAGENQNYSAGQQRLVSSVNGWKVNLMVCYDLRFPVWCRQQFNADHSAEYDVLIFVANWPEKRRTAWKTLLKARAIENQCYVLGVNRVGEDGNGFYHSGDSSVIDPMGDILYQKADEEDVFTITITKDHLKSVRNKLPFLNDADPFLLINDPAKSSSASA